MTGFFQRLFSKREAAHEPSPPPHAGQIKIEEFGHNLVSIDALDFIGHQAVSPNRRYRRSGRAGRPMAAEAVIEVKDTGNGRCLLMTGS